MTPSTGIVHTEHYSFELQVKIGKTRNVVLQVGNDVNPCLQIIIPGSGQNNRLRNISTVATMPSVDSLRYCLSKEVSDDYFKKYSFAREMLQKVIAMMRRVFPHIKEIRLTDASFIPCNRPEGDILDLFTYNIALYGKTWYEMHFGAKQRSKAYDKALAEYLKERPTDFEGWLSEIEMQNTFAFDWIMDRYDMIRDLYIGSRTYPDFYDKLSKMMDFTEKCRFFKTWLVEFMMKRVPDHRSWYIPLCGAQSGGKTRRRRKMKI